MHSNKNIWCFWIIYTFTTIVSKVVPKLKAKLQLQAQPLSNRHEEVLPHMNLSFFFFAHKEMKPICGRREITTLGH